MEEGGGGQWMGQEGVSTSTPCPLLGVQTVQQGFEHIRSQGGTRRRVVRECSQQLSSSLPKISMNRRRATRSALHARNGVLLSNKTEPTRAIRQLNLTSM